MVFKKAYLLFILPIWSFNSLAQSETTIPRNNVYFEVGGAAFFYSFNYERLLFNNAEKNVALRIGTLLMPKMGKNRRNIQGIPIGASYIRKMKKLYYEAGISFAALRDNYEIGSDNLVIDDLVTVTSLRGGIRKQPNKNGLFWNALLQASAVFVYDYQDFNVANAEKSVIPMISFGIGYSFGKLN